MSGFLVDSLCRATDEASNRVRDIYADEKVMTEGTYTQFGDTELYIHGGGFSGIWAVGIMQVFRTLESSGAMKIHILHGYSIGAILAVFYARNLSTKQSIEAYYLLQEHADGSGLYSACRHVMQRVLPENAHELCNGRVRIGMTQKFPILWYREESDFPNRESLIDAIVNSTSIPYVTAPVTDTVNNYVDGLFGHTLWGWSSPRLGRAGIELLPPCIGYSYVFSPTDPYIYGLIMNGLTDIIYFLQNKPTKYIRNLSYMPWHVGKFVRFVDRVHWNLLQRVT